MAPFDSALFLSMLALIAAVIVISALLSGLIERSGFPQVAVFLGLGAILGSAGLNLLRADLSSPILRVVANLSLVLVLFTDALSINVAEVRQRRLLSFLVLGPGTLLSAVLIAALGWLILGLHPAAAIILGAALASTDPVLLRGVLRRPALPPTVRQALRLESGMNDAVLLPLVFAGMTVLGQGRTVSAGEWAHAALNILILSPAAGAAIGLAGIGMLELVRRRISVRRDYESIYSLGIAFAAFAAAESVHGSGFLAAFAAGVTIAALDVELCDCFLEYGETTSELALMFAFVLFGTSLIWSGFSNAGIGTLLFAVGVFAARLVAFLPALAPARIGWKQSFFIAWFGPRGLSSLLLILLPVFAGVPGAQTLFTICCFVVVCSVVLHGLSPMLLTEPHSASTARRPSAPAANEPAVSIPGRAAPSCGDGCASPDSMEAPDGLADREYITIEELQRLQRGSAPPIIVDSRTERTYSQSSEKIPGSIRVDPDHAVESALRQEVPKHAILAVLCA